MIIGVVGGLYALLWAAFGYCISDYESFHKSTGLISDFYSSENGLNAVRNDNSDLKEEDVEAAVKRELGAR